MTQTTLYLAIMVGIIVLVVAVAAPALFYKKCSRCGRRNGLDAPVCKYCGSAFPDDSV